MPRHIESALALAQAALETREFDAARAALADYLPAPTKRVATLMAEIEDSEGDVGRAREWMARAMRAAPDPVWTADGAVSDHWLPVAPLSGRLDAFEWKVPVAEIGVERPLIEPDQIAPRSAVAPAIEKPSPPVAPVGMAECSAGSPRLGDERPIVRNIDDAGPTLAAAGPADEAEPGFGALEHQDIADMRARRPLQARAPRSPSAVSTRRLCTRCHAMNATDPGAPSQ
jgi:HemY protein